MQLTPSTRRGLFILYTVSVVVVALVILAFIVKVRDVDKFKHQVNVLAAQVESLGGTPVVGTPGQQGPQGEPGANATDAQVAAAVRGYLVAHPPAPGRGPTSEEVVAGVAAFCAVNPCGSSSVAPAPTDAQIASAVSTFCAARNNCVGSTGPAGVNGVDGAAGRPPSSFTITLQGNKLVTCTPDTPPDPGSSPHYTCTPA